MKKEKLFLLLIFIVGASIIGSSFLIAESVKKNLHNNVIQQFYDSERVLSKEVSAVLEEEVRNVIDKLYISAKIPEIKTGSTEVCNKKLKEVSDILGGRLGNIGRVNQDGKFQCSLNPALIGVEAQTLGQYMVDIFDDPDHKPVMSRAIKPVGADSYLVGVHIPVYDNNNQFIGTLGGAIYFSDLKNKFLKQIQLSPNGFAVLLDDDGTILHHADQSLIGQHMTSKDVLEKDGYKYIYRGILENVKAGQTGNTRYMFDGLEKIAAYYPVNVMSGRAWTNIVTTPIQDLDEQIGALRIERMFKLFIFAETVVITFFLLLLVYFMRRQFSKERIIDRAKDEFISLASHQLRTPLTAIRLYSEILKGEKLKPAHQEYVDIIEDSTLRMIKLVGDILNVSRIQLGSLRIDPKPASLEALLKSVVSEIAPVATQRTIKIIFKKPAVKLPQVNIDTSIMRQVVHNLITNAVRYSHDGGTVRVELALNNRPAGYLISVVDNGIGIPKDSQEKIFQRFFRADNAIKQVGEGTGLGMYMAKMIIDKIGGSIWFESEENKGTKFYVIIPKKGMLKKDGTKSLDN